MRPAPARTVHTVDFADRPAPRPTVAATGRVPRVTRLLALAHKIDTMVRSGELQDLADAARRLGLTRARVTQVMNLLLLAPRIQEAILGYAVLKTGREPITERSLRPIVAEPDWGTQIRMWRRLGPSTEAS